MNKTILGLAIAMLSGAVSALAIPSTLSVDFRSPGWQSAAGKTSDTVNNVTVTAVYPPGSTLIASSTLGIGINAPTPSSGTIDILNVTFSLASGNGLTGAWVTNLGTLEAGELVLDTTQGDYTFSFNGLEASSGDYFINFGSAYNVTSAQFYTVNATSSLGVPDYSVAGFSDPPAVPDGGTTLTLLGIGFISLTAFRRRFAL